MAYTKAQRREAWKQRTTETATALREANSTITRTGKRSIPLSAISPEQIRVEAWRQANPDRYIVDYSGDYEKIIVDRREPPKTSAQRQLNIILQQYNPDITQTGTGQAQTIDPFTSRYAPKFRTPLEEQFAIKLLKASSESDIIIQKYEKKYSQPITRGPPILHSSAAHILQTLTVSAMAGALKFISGAGFQMAAIPFGVGAMASQPERTIDTFTKPKGESFLQFTKRTQITDPIVSTKTHFVANPVATVGNILGAGLVLFAGARGFKTTKKTSALTEVTASKNVQAHVSPRLTAPVPTSPLHFSPKMNFVANMARPGAKKTLYEYKPGLWKSTEANLPGRRQVLRQPELIHQPVVTVDRPLIIWLEHRFVKPKVLEVKPQSILSKNRPVSVLEYKTLLTTKTKHVTAVKLQSLQGLSVPQLTRTFSFIVQINRLSQATPSVYALKPAQVQKQRLPLKSVSMAIQKAKTSSKSKTLTKLKVIELQKPIILPPALKKSTSGKKKKKRAGVGSKARVYTIKNPLPTLKTFLK